jgi:hypothetical protein
MEMSLVAAEVTAAAACGAMIAALWGLRYGKGQIDTAVHDRKVDRAIGCHADLTTGEVGAARNRFSRLMFRVGEEALGPTHCWRPTWASLFPPVPGLDDDANEARYLGEYPAEMLDAQLHTPLHDLRLVLWCFERIDEARQRESLLDEKLLASLIGYHVAWWSLLCARLEHGVSGHLYSLQQLATWAEEQGWRSDARNEHRPEPEQDFPGGEDKVPLPTSTGRTGSGDPARHLPALQKSSLFGHRLCHAYRNQ